MIPALITNRNNPNDKTVTGTVRITKIGFTKEFRNANATARIRADLNPSTWTILSGNKYAVARTASVEINILVMKFIG